MVAQKDQGLLYAIFHYLKLIQTHQSLDGVSVKEVPQIKYRVLNHWDNLDGTIERGYAGYSFMGLGTFAFLSKSTMCRLCEGKRFQ